MLGSISRLSYLEETKHIHTNKLDVMEIDGTKRSS